MKKQFAYKIDSLLVASMLYSRMQTLPIYSTSSFCNSTPSALEYYFDESVAGTYNATQHLFRYNCKTPSEKSRRSRPRCRQRRTLARSRSTGACTRNAFEMTNSYSEYPDLNIYSNENIYGYHINSYYNNFDSYSALGNKITKPHLSPKTRTHKHFSKRKLQKQPTRYYQNLNNMNDDDLYKKYDEVMQNLTVMPLRTLSDIPFCRSSNEISLSELNLDTHIKNQDDTHHHYHGYASDDSIPETTIHISVEKQNSLDIQPYKIHQNVALSPKLSELHSNSHSCPLITYFERKKYLSLDLETNSKDQIDSPEYNIITRDSSNVICRSRSDSMVSIKSPPTYSKPMIPEERNAIFKKMYVPTMNNKGPIKKNLKEYKISNICKNEDIYRKNKIRSCNNPYSPTSFPTQRSHVDTLLNNSLGDEENAYTPTAATYHLIPDYSKMANSLSVGLSPTNLGSPCGLLTSDAPHLPPDDTHHKTTEATTYLHGDRDSTVAEKTKPRTSSHGEPNSLQNDGKPISETINANSETDLNTTECSNDYGGRDNGRNHSQQQPLERRESRRGQFTRSLSNADVPPDEKAGIISYFFHLIILYFILQNRTGVSM